MKFILNETNTKHLRHRFILAEAGGFRLVEATTNLGTFQQDMRLFNGSGEKIISFCTQIIPAVEGDEKTKEIKDYLKTFKEAKDKFFDANFNETSILTADKITDELLNHFNNEGKDYLKALEDIFTKLDEKDSSFSHTSFWGLFGFLGKIGKKGRLDSLKSFIAKVTEKRALTDKEIKSFWADSKTINAELEKWADQGQFTTSKSAQNILELCKELKEIKYTDLYLEEKSFTQYETAVGGDGVKAYLEALKAVVNKISGLNQAMDPAKGAVGNLGKKEAKTEGLIENLLKQLKESLSLLSDATTSLNKTITTETAEFGDAISEDWNTAYKKYMTEKPDRINYFWQEYWVKAWGSNNIIKELLEESEKEILSLRVQLTTGNGDGNGNFKAGENPVVGYLQTVIQKDTYAGISNVKEAFHQIIAFVVRDNVVSKRALAGNGVFKTQDIIFSNSFYKVSAADMLKYINFQNTISKNAASDTKEATHLEIMYKEDGKTLKDLSTIETAITDGKGWTIVNNTVASATGVGSTTVSDVEEAINSLTKDEATTALGYIKSAFIIKYTKAFITKLFDGKPTIVAKAEISDDLYKKLNLEANYSEAQVQKIVELLFSKVASVEPSSSPSETSGA